MSVAAAAALHLDRGDRPSGTHHEVDFLVALAPVEELGLSRGGCVGEVGADSRLHQASPELTVLTGLLEQESGLGAHERCIEHLQLGARALLPDGAPGELGEPGQQPGAAEQLEVVRERRRIAGVVKLAEHLRVRQHLSGVPATQLEQASQKGRLVHAGEQQDVAGDRRLHQRVEDVPTPAAGLVRERRGARIASEVDVLVDGEVERGPHLRERPVRQAQDFEASGQAFHEALLDEERCGAE